MKDNRQDCVEEILEQMVIDEGMDSQENLDPNTFSAKPQELLNDNITAVEKEKRAKTRRKKSPPSFDDLKIKRGIQNLEERARLIKYLFVLFIIQLSVMNFIVFITVLWVALDLPFFKNTDLDTLEIIVNMIKYYITVVLAELLGGIIFIVHQVFSDKTIDKLGG